MIKSENEFTFKGIDFEARSNDVINGCHGCHGCWFKKYNENYESLYKNCTEIRYNGLRPHCCGEGREDGRDVIFVQVEDKPKSMKTRSGIPVLLINRVEGKSLFPLQAVLARKNGSLFINEYTEDGFYLITKEEHPLDLIFED